MLSHRVAIHLHLSNKHLDAYAENIVKLRRSMLCIEQML